MPEGQLLEITNDGGLESMFKTTSNIHILWIKVKVEYPEIATKALKSLLPFPASYFCEVDFAAVTATKTMTGHKHPQTRRGLTLLSQLCRDPVVGVRKGEERSEEHTSELQSP